MMKNKNHAILTCLSIILLASCSQITTISNTIEPISTQTELFPTITVSAIVQTETITLTAEAQATQTQATQTQAPTSTQVTPTAVVKNYSYQILERITHDPGAFTQGLVFSGGNLYESTGLYGSSSVRKFDLHTQKIEQIYLLPDDIFGEGLTIVGNKLIQLTWKTHKGFIYDLDSFEKLDEFYYPTEGWGLTYDGQSLIMSDGTSTIRYLDPVNYQEIRFIEVKEKDQPIENINELEYINGNIYANIWKTAKIAIIDPQNGAVLAWINLSGIIQKEFSQIEEINYLNGIAYDKENDKLFITGKNWPAIFVIDMIDGNQAE